MGIDSFDVSGKSASEKHIHQAANASYHAPYKKKEVAELLQLMNVLPKGAYAMHEAFLIFTYEPSTQTVHPKPVGHTKSKNLDHYLLLDTINNRVFAPLELLSNEIKTLIHEQIEQHVQGDVVWIDVPSHEWNVVHTTFTEHLDVYHQHMGTSPVKTEKDTRIANKRESEKEKEEEKKKELEELQEKLQAMTLAELAKLFAEILNKMSESEQEFIEHIEKEKDIRSEERQDAIDAKEHLKETIKFEVNTLHLIAEAQKKMSEK